MNIQSAVVFQGKSKTGEGFFIRYPAVDDAQIMCDYINTLSKEQTFIRFQGESVTMAEEKDFLENFLTKITKGQAVMLLVFISEKLVGISQIEMKDRTEAHEGEFGISLEKSVRGQGIGKALMQTLMSEVEKHIPQLRVITLSVFANNGVAHQMYEQLGFREYGRLPNGIAYKGGYVDHIFMYRSVS